MDLKKLRYFAAVARAGSFVAASRELHVSQPALGTRVKELETALGVRLFDRTPRGVQLTAAGTDLLRHCDRILACVEDALTSMEAHKRTPFHHYTLGVTPTPGKALLPDLLRACGPETGLKLTIREGLSIELLEQARAKRVDMAFCYDPPADTTLTMQPLYREDLHLVGPPHILNGIGKRITFDDIAGLPLVLDSCFQITRKLIESVAAEHGVTLDVRMEIEPINLKRDVLIANDLCSIVPFGLFLEELESGVLTSARIEEPALARTLCLVARPGLSGADVGYMERVLTPIIAAKIAESRLAWRQL